MIMAAREKVGITLTKETLKRLEAHCEKTGIPKSYAITIAINSYLNEQEGGGGSESK